MLQWIFDAEMRIDVDVQKERYKSQEEKLLEREAQREIHGCEMLQVVESFVRKWSIPQNGHSKMREQKSTTKFYRSTFSDELVCYILVWDPLTCLGLKAGCPKISWVIYLFSGWEGAKELRVSIFSIQGGAKELLRASQAHDRYCF